METKYLLWPLNIVLKVLVIATGKEKKRRIGEEMIKLLFTGDMVVYIGNSKEYIDNLRLLINEFIKLIVWV